MAVAVCRFETMPVEAQQPSVRPAGQKSVLIIDDEVAICRALERVLRSAGFAVTTTSDANHAIEKIMSESFDVILSDIMMPRMSGIDLLRVIRAYDVDVSVILMTGNPTLETAVDAMALGALQYLPKPTPNEVLVKAVERGSQLHRMAIMKRDAVKLLDAQTADADVRVERQATFDRALDSMYMAFQPIVDRTRSVIGYEALMRPREPGLASPLAMFDAADELHRVTELGRHARVLTARAFAAAPKDALLFVNLHPRELLDSELYESTSPLAQFASRVVLEITERAALSDVKDIVARISVLRYQGFRIAIDDLGAGYAGLASFAALEPDIVKLDMSLVRNAHESVVRQRLIASMTSLCKEMKIKVVAEGVETEEELACVRKAGCDLLQGYLFAKPAPLDELLNAGRG